MIIGLQEVVVFYQYFYSKKYNSPKYKFSPPSQAISRMQTFLTELDRRYDLNCLGKTFLTNYFLFQFNRTHHQVFQRFSSKTETGAIKVGGRIQIYDVIGKQALKYWVDRDPEFDWVLYQTEFAKDCNINIVDLHALLEGPQRQPPGVAAEEIEKRRFHNTARGFLNCLERTTLFDSSTLTCVRCQFKRDCKQMLESNYPAIYSERNGSKQN